MSLVIFSSQVVMPTGMTAAAIEVAGEKIVGIELVDASAKTEFVGSLLPDRNFIDASDFVVSPGIIDAHVHVNEPGRTEWEGFATATRAAAAGGVTTLFDMPLNSSPVTTSLSALRAKQSYSSSVYHVDVGFHGGLIPANVAELESLIAAGVVGIKAFLCDSGLDEFPAADERTLRDALPILKKHQIPLLVHAEIVSELNDDSTSGDVRSYHRFANSRPPEFELSAIKLLIRLCREFETPIHVVHLAAAKALPLIRAAKEDGLPLSVETCPHYLYFDDTDIDDGQTEFKCAPPIRDIANRMLLCEAVADGTIDTIGSDHSPCPVELKLLEAGDFMNAWGGISGLQLSLPATWSVGKRLGWSPHLIAQKFSANPAKIFGVSQTGSIEVGRNADLVIWNPDESVTVDGNALFHRHNITPYQGRCLDGVVWQTYLRGEKIYDSEQVVKFGIAHRGRIVTCVRASTDATDAIAEYLNALKRVELSNALETCCASQTWINRMVEGGKFGDDLEVLSRAKTSWENLSEADYLEAFSAHPRIGDVDTLRTRYANTKELAGNEQAGVISASEDTLIRLAEANEEYFKKFGFIFIVFATGKTADEMLAILESRLPNDRETEIQNAAVAQLKITQLRLQNLSGS